MAPYFMATTRTYFPFLRGEVRRRRSRHYRSLERTEHERRPKTTCRTL